ncbi:HNH endonuclease [Bacillus safensis]|uniref:HNH endonuclease n=1 Tax=Bacillus safensis TaxID=561879 RepID=UPI0022AAD429|nr:HNH endonuclease [Bacillus safensis]MCZ2736973.1 HNH endonuclease [Bacillus safensis]
MALATINPIDLGSDVSFLFYDKIVNSKRGDRKRILYGEIINDNVIYSELYKKIKEKYRVYDKHVRILELLVEDSYSEVDKEALQHCYDGSTVALIELKRTIIKNQSSFYQSKCAYCGIDGIDGMDHYIPKEKFPEYAVHPHNLIPACSCCNGKKSDLFLNGSEIQRRAFFNPYFDEININILNLEIEYLESTNSFSFKLNVEDENYIVHLDTLGIIHRYEKEAINIFDNLRIEIISSFEAHFDMYDNLSTYEKSFKNQLKKSRDIKLRERGINSLDFLVYDSFYKSEYCSVAFFINMFEDSNSKLKLANKGNIKMD